jgi:hypothetical protein
MMFGLSSANSDSSFKSIGYALLTVGDKFYIYESGSHKGYAVGRYAVKETLCQQ